MTAAEKAALALEPDDRLRLIETIWESLRLEVGDALPVSEATKAELDRRITAHDADPGSTMGWNDIKAKATSES